MSDSNSNFVLQFCSRHKTTSVCHLDGRCNESNSILKFSCKESTKSRLHGTANMAEVLGKKKSDRTERTHKSVKWLVQPILLHIIHSLPQLLNYSSLLKPYNPNCRRPCSKFPCSVSPCTALRDYLSHVENHNICGIGDQNISAAGEKQRKWAGGGRWFIFLSSKLKDHNLDWRSRRMRKRIKRDELKEVEVKLDPVLLFANVTCIGKVIRLKDP